MPKKPRARTLTDSQHVKESETQHECLQQYFCQIFWSLWKKISSKNSVLIVSEILRHFVKILTPDDKYFLPVKANVYWNQFKCYYLIIKKYFLNFFLHFRNLGDIGNTMKEKMSLGGYLFLRL